MRESAEIARDLLWAEASQLDIDVKTFESNGMHVHVPAGAIPKDGPSAGIALATAITSLLTRKPVRSDTAMTGEITLAGWCCQWAASKKKCWRHAALACNGSSYRRLMLRIYVNSPKRCAMP